MRDGFELKLDGGKDAGEVRSRRCYEEWVDGEKREVVELTFETFSPHWFLTSLSLTPRAALELGIALVHEAALPMSEAATLVTRPEVAV